MSEQLPLLDLMHDVDETQQAVKVHSAGIHIEHKMTVTQRKAWFFMLFNAFKAPEDQDVYQMSISELANAIGCQASNLKRIKETLEGMVGITVKWDIFDKVSETDERGHSIWGVASLLADCEVIPFTGLCEYSFSAKMRRRFLKPSMFVKLNLLITRGFTSKNSLAIYCLALDYLIVKDNYGEKNLSIEQIRQLLGLPNDKYARVVDLHKHVLKRAEQDINEKSDMRLEILPIKQGRRIVGFKLKMSIKPEHLDFYRKKNALLARSERGSDDGSVIDITPFRPQDERVRDFFARHKLQTTALPFRNAISRLKEMFEPPELEAYVLYVVEHVEAEARKGEIRSLSGFFIQQLSQQPVLNAYMLIRHQERERQQLEAERVAREAAELEQALDARLMGLYHQGLRVDFKAWLEASFEAQLPIMEKIFQEQLKPFHRNYISTKYGGRITPAHLQDPTFMLELLSQAEVFGYDLPDFADWKRNFRLSEPDKAHELLTQAQKEMRAHSKR